MTDTEAVFGEALHRANARAEALVALYRDLVEMHAVIRISVSESMWRWVLSPAALDLLREYAKTSTRADVDLSDDEWWTVFGIPMRIDEHAVGPMLELRR